MKSWNNKFRSQIENSNQVNSFLNNQHISNCFANHFSATYITSVSDSASKNECAKLYDNLILKESFKSLCHSSLFSIEVIDKCVKSLKLGKAQGPDSLSAEHLLHSHQIIYLQRGNLFKTLVIHGFVPDDFGNEMIIPLIKDKSSPVGSLSNYRAITLIPIISKLFEGVLLNIANDLLISDDLQFGFKKNTGCAKALYMFRSAADHFNANESSVYVATLQISKTFDVINHFKLFSALIHFFIGK